MKTKPGRDAPAAVPYGVMPAYRATAELLDALQLLSARMPPHRGRIGYGLREKGTRMLLAAAEGGARPELWRRILQYRYAWFGTFDVEGLLISARRQHLVHPDAMLGPEALFRIAQQALTLAAGAMTRRQRKRRGDGDPLAG